MLRVLRQGMSGDDIRRWQLYLIGQEYTPGPVDGVFNEQTAQAVGAFQKTHNLHSDGVIDNLTWATAMVHGFGITMDSSRDESSSNWPPQPGFTPLNTNGAKIEVFGKFTYQPVPVSGCPEAIRVIDGWYAKNIVQTAIPQFKKNSNLPHSIQFNHLAVNQLLTLWEAWEKAELLDTILSWDGSYDARFMRGSRVVLSGHAFGIAFEINSQFNRLGAQPALLGEKGSVRQLVSIANEHGFYWGGHCDNRPEGSHFEIAQLYTKVAALPTSPSAPHEPKSQLNAFKLYSLSKRAIDEDPDIATQGVNIVLDEVSHLLDGNEFEKIDTILSELNVGLLHADIIIAILTVTQKHPELKARQSFLERATIRITEIDGERATKILDPLR
jgi:hypothetical protein